VGERDSHRAALPNKSEYHDLLESKNLWPINPDKEQNWSGRGEHVAFEKNERNLVKQILQEEELLG
jgi:hypothetical protein